MCGNNLRESIISITFLKNGTLTNVYHYDPRTNKVILYAGGFKCPFDIQVFCFSVLTQSPESSPYTLKQRELNLNY